MIHSSLERVSRDVPLAIEWRAFELQPQEAGPFDPDALAEKKRQIDAYWPTVQRIAQEQYGLQLKQGELGIDTRLAHIGAKVARNLGQEDAYHAEVFQTHWIAQKDISDPEVLVEIASGLGLDANAFRQGLQDDTLRAEVLDEELGAQQIGIRGVPALIIANRYLLSGAQPADRLLQLFQRYQERGTLE